MRNLQVRSCIWGLLVVLAGALVIGDAYSDQVAARPGFEAGREAYAGGDFQSARRIWSSLAQAGHPAAQAGLALIYARGQGVAPDAERASALAQAAADANDPQGQFLLGTLYLAGQGGLRQSSLMAFVWCDLAMSNGSSDATICRDEAQRRLPEAEVIIGFRLVSQWRTQRPSASAR